MSETELVQQLRAALEEMAARGVACSGDEPASQNAPTVVLDPTAARAIYLALERALDQLEPITFSEPESNVALSPRQAEVLFWVAAGKSNGVIGDIMGISPHTVDTHLRRIFFRLGTSDRTVAAIEAIKRGVIAHPKTVVS